MPSISFWNNHNNRSSSSSSPAPAYFSSKDKVSNFFSSFPVPFNNKTLLQKQDKSKCTQANKNLLNQDIPLLLEQPGHIKIQCDYILFQTVLANQDNDELLWCLAKRLKQQEDIEEPSSNQEQQHHSQITCYRRAIRILIYYFHAHHYHPKYYKKCIQVLGPCSCCPLDVQETISEIQHSATNKSIDTTIVTNNAINNKFLTTSSRTMSVSSYSTNSSYASSTSSNCSHCGIEKRAMPVCARCKSQAYCSNKCRMAHQPIHQRECNNSQ